MILCPRDTYDSGFGHQQREMTLKSTNQYKSLLDSQRLHDLQVHEGRIPICEVFVRSAGLAMTQELDGEEVHSGGELRVAILASVEV